MTKRILSGVQPTGNLHLGNYLGAIRNWVRLQGDYECLFMLADLHAITVPQEPEKLRAHVRETAAAYIACGINPDKSAIFHQSAVSAHCELTWILSCHTPLGWLNRMTQFKEKAQQTKIGMDDLVKAAKDLSKEVKKLLKIVADEGINKNAGLAAAMLGEYDKYFQESNWEQLKLKVSMLEQISDAASSNLENSSRATLGLYSYPVLMAADILAYKATHVPVGEDQKQHLELCRDIAGAFNRNYNTEFFPLPEPVILGEAKRIMSLRDGTKKMSKSDESDYSRINLTDDADAIARKIKKATSDMVEGDIRFDEKRPEATNLLTIYAALRDITKEQAETDVAGKNFSAFKQMLTDVAVKHLSPITRNMRELLESPDYIDQVLARGVAKAQGIAGKTMNEVKDLVGFLKVSH